MPIAKPLALALTLAISSYHTEFSPLRTQVVERAGSSGDTSGPAIGAPVEPSTAAEKKNPYLHKQREPGESGMSAGAPGIEGERGTESGAAASPKR